MGFPNASGIHLTVCTRRFFFDLSHSWITHSCLFCPRAVDIYTQQTFKIVTPILIIRLMMGCVSRPIVRNSKKKAIKSKNSRIFSNASSKNTWLQCAFFQRRDTSKMLVSQGKGQKSLLSNNFWAPSIGKTFLWVKWS